MMGIQLSAEGPGGIDKDLIIDHGTALGTGDLPAARVQRAYCERPAGAIFRAHPVYVFREVTHLIQRVPDWKLQLPQRRPFRQDDLHFDQVLLGIGESNGVVRDGVGWRRSRSYPEQKDEAKHAPRYASLRDGEVHRFPATFADFTLSDSPASARN